MKERINKIVIFFPLCYTVQTAIYQVPKNHSDFIRQEQCANKCVKIVC